MNALIVVGLAGLAGATEPEVPPSILTVAPAFTDLGTVAPGATVSWSLGVTHTQGLAVTLEGADLLGDPGFAFDGVIPALGDLDSAALGFTFAATTPGPHEVTVEVRSDADCTEPAPVVARAWVAAPCVSVWPDVLDFGPIAAGSTADLVVRLAPCAGTPVQIDGLVTDGTLAVSAELPLIVGASGALLRLTAAPADELASVAQLDLTVGGVAVADLFARANDCPQGDPTRWDADGDGLSDCGADPDPAWTDDDGDGASEHGGDCDDTDETVGPEADEVGNGRDDDCDGLADEHLDGDGDGAAVPADCDDTNPWVRPGADEIQNGADDDCDGAADESIQVSDNCPPWDQPPAEDPGCGCGGGSVSVGWGWLALLALRRRR